MRNGRTSSSSADQSYYPPPHYPPAPSSRNGGGSATAGALVRRPPPVADPHEAQALTPYRPPPPNDGSQPYPDQYNGHYPGGYHHGQLPHPAHYSAGPGGLVPIAPGNLAYIPRHAPPPPHHPYYGGGGYPPSSGDVYEYSPPTSKGVSPIRPQYSPPPIPPPSAPRSDHSGYAVKQKNEPALVVFPADCPWPPPSQSGYLTEAEARKWIATGTPTFRGEVHPVPLAPKGNFYFYAFSSKGNGTEWEDCAPSMNEYDAFEDMSSALTQVESVEKPAMSGSHGLYPGTVTLSYYAASYSTPVKAGEGLVQKRKLRKVSMLYVLDRLRFLQGPKGTFDERDCDLLYHNLYTYLLHENPRADPHEQYSLEAQIEDLTAALMRSSWIDFSIPENQIVSRFFHNAEGGVTNSFFHQLLLAVELHLRILALQQVDDRFNPLKMLPEKVNWDLVLAKRWLEKVSVEAPKKSRREGSSVISFTFKHKKTQIEVLRNFGFTLKWPNMFEVQNTLDDDEEMEGDLEDRSVNCMAWFTGVLLPGKSIPWIVMNALIDCDPDVPEEFKDLPINKPIGLQYRGLSYWHYESIVGRVMAAALGVSQIGGWIGPCIFSVDLQRCEVVLVNQAFPKATIRLTPEDIEDMHFNSDPLGACQQRFPIDDYDPIVLDTSRPVDTIRIEKLNFTKSPIQPPPSSFRPGRIPPTMYDASITFAIESKSWKVNLRYDTPFIAAYPCHKGPHVLFCEYKFRIAKVDTLVDIHDWGARKGFRVRGSEAGSRVSKRSSTSYDDSESGDEDGASELEEVLVVEAYGVPDNAVFARSWCAYWGVAAVTADLKNTCFACGVRQAYAARVSVVILTDSAGLEYEVEEVDRLMENL